MPSTRAAKTLQSIAANVRRLRAERGLTQEQLAEAADVDLRFLQRVEQGSRNFGVVALVDLACALDAGPGELLKEAALAARPRGRPRQRAGAESEDVELRVAPVRQSPGSQARKRSRS